MQHSSRLRYVDADEVGSEVIDFDGLKVRRPDGEKLGEVDGFIVDRDARRAYYVVVDSGGWFKSQQYLVPIGHARLDDDGDALVLDVTRESISRYPEFDRDSFERFDDEELRSYQGRFDEACCGDAVGTHDHFAQPTWWRTEYYNWDVPAGVGTTGAVAASGRRTALDDALPGDIDNDEPEKHRRDREAELVGTRGVEGGDVSPHLGGRAQPGDVLGVETGGERTELGDTDQEENKRRRDAERASGRDIKD
jgi:hypothetical protein